MKDVESVEDHGRVGLSAETAIELGAGRSLILVGHDEYAVDICVLTAQALCVLEDVSEQVPIHTDDRRLLARDAERRSFSRELDFV